MFLSLRAYEAEKFAAGKEARCFLDEQMDMHNIERAK